LNIRLPAPSHASEAGRYPGPPNPPDTGEDWNLIDCLRALYRRRSTVLGITVLGAAIAALISAVAPRWYQSQASIEVQGANENFLSLRDVYPMAGSADTSPPSIQTQADLLQQDATIEQVVRKLNLQDRREFQTGPGLWSRIRGKTGKAGRSVPAVQTAVEMLQRNIRIVPLRNSRVIQIFSEARSAPLAAEIANGLAETFVEQNIMDRQRAARQTYETLTAQLAELRSRPLNSRTEASRREVYDAMLQKADQARIASGLRQSNIRIAGWAQPASHPYRPNLPLNLAIGSFGGLVLGIGLVMLQEQTNSVLRAPGEAGNWLPVPELGAIPKAPLPRLSLFSLPNWGAAPLQVERAALEQRSSTLSEAFRTTLASILSAGRNGDHPRLLVVTSSRPMEGKTTVVSNLGIALAEISEKVLLIDGDMRRPRLHRVFDQANSWGLSDLLAEQNAIDDLPLDVLVRKTAIPHLYLLPSGACTENVFGLLHSGRMSRLLPRFRQEFDYVLVDAPPCLEFADARIMARYAETLLLVVRANYTDRKTAHAAVNRLLLDGIPVMGVILNRWDPARSDLYRYPAFYGASRQDLA
jgi:polysaccharide biosynthesis transport protein